MTVAASATSEATPESGRLTAAVGHRSEDEFGVALRNQVVLEVVRQRSDRPGRVRHAAGVCRRWDPGRGSGWHRQLGVTRAEKPVYVGWVQVQADRGRDP